MRARACKPKQMRVRSFAFHIHLHIFEDFSLPKLADALFMHFSCAAFLPIHASYDHLIYIYIYRISLM